jgi:formylglycine-generating enzyme required for sulfatase activity
MADVFVSYKREDISSAERIATSLRKEGLSIWWDERVTPIDAWDATIEREIADAATVMVLWTPRSICSEWVRTEAYYAKDRGKLIPVLLEECAIPMAFLLRQTVHLCGWTGDCSDREWRKLLTWIGDLKSTKPGNANLPQALVAAKPNPFRDVLGHLPSGDPIVDGGFVNAVTPAGTVFHDGDHMPVMRILPKGAFLLGSTSNDPNHTAVEGPQRRMEIPAPFAIGVYPVLVEEYQRVVGQLPSISSAAPEPRSWWKFGKAPFPQRSATAAFVDRAPMTWISFDDAQGFVERLTSTTGERYRVPSEVEWEYACRAGSAARYSFGDQLDPTMALFAAVSGPAPAGRYSPNAFGLYDMHGNVREWAADLWHESYDSTPADGSPATDGHSSMRVVRGGGWCDDASLLRSAARMRATQSARSHFIGLRVARSLG